MALTERLLSHGLYHIEAVARKIGFSPLEVGMSKLKGTGLGDVNTVSQDGNLLWFQLHQLLKEHYLNVSYALDMFNTYAHLAKGESESITQYLSWAKVLLECIHHISKMCDIAGSSYNNLYLVQGFLSPHI